MCDLIMLSYEKWKSIGRSTHSQQDYQDHNLKNLRCTDSAPSSPYFWLLLSTSIFIVIVKVSVSWAVIVVHPCHLVLILTLLRRGQRRWSMASSGGTQKWSMVSARWATKEATGVSSDVCVRRRWLDVACAGVRGRQSWTVTVREKEMETVQ